ncbi:MAG: PAS domain S-box protein [Calditrichaeota bacterium]|nr:MAG: PAS domain S-box protein [Calditrichota bacterium]
MFMEALNLLRIGFIFITGVILLIAVRKKFPQPLQGKNFVTAGWALISLNMLIGAFFHSSLVPESWMHEFYGLVGILSGRVGQPLGLLFLVIGAGRLMHGLNEQLDSKYHSLVHNALVGVYIVQDGRLVYCNPKFAEIFGYSQEALRDLPVKKLVHPEDWSMVSENLDRRLRGEVEALHYELRGLRKNGQEFVAEVFGSRTLHRGRPAVHGTLVDVTERHQIMEKLRQSEGRYRLLIENSPQAVAVFSRERVVFINRSGLLLLGASRPEEVVGRSIYDFVPPEDRPVLKEEKPPRTGTTLRRRILRLDGRIVQVEMAAVAFEFEGEPAVYLIGRDVTREAELERQLRQEQERRQLQNQTLVTLSTSQELWHGNQESVFRDIARAAAETLSVSQVGIWLLSPDGEQLILACQFHLETGSFTQGTVLQTHRFPQYMSALKESRIIDATDAVKDSRTREFSEFYLKPLGIASMLDAPVRLGGRLVGVVCHEHVGQRRQWHPDEQQFAAALADLVSLVLERAEYRRAQAALQESEQRHRTLFESVPVGLYRTTPDGRVIDVNQTMVEMLGYPDKASLVATTADNFYVDKAERARWQEELHRKGILRNYVTRYRRYDGTFIWVRENSRIVRDEAGAVVAYYGSLQDITEKVLAERRLAEEKERLQITLKSIGDGVIATNTAGQVLIMNPVAEQLTGWQEAEAHGHFLGRFFAIIREKENEPVELSPDWFCCPDRLSQLSGAYLLKSRNGEQRPILCTASPMVNEANEVNGCVLVFRDISQQRQLEEEMMKAEKLESLSILAGGLAHDFNNILTAILGNLSLAKMRLKDPSDLLPVLDNAEKASLRARDLTQQLLTFAKGGTPVKKVMSLQQLVTETARFALHGSSVKPEFHIAQDLWSALADEGQISQVLHNLIINAVQAMPHGGRLRIAAKNLQISEPITDQGVRIRPGRYVKITIEDEGEGIPPEILPKVFDPYFTTKKTGTGLGLASCYSIVRRHEGFITLSSKVGKGTRVNIYLPAADQNGKPIDGNGQQRVYRRSGGRILLMDDEPPIRDLVKMVLSEHGFEVVTTGEGQEAVSAFQQARQTGKPFDLVILDLTIPGGMGGAEAIQQIRTIDPHVAAIVSSGYNNDPILGNYARFGFDRCVSKPFRVQELLDAVYELINTSASCAEPAPESRQ